MHGVVWKYGVPSSPGEFKLNLRVNSGPLKMGVQDGKLVLWVVLDTDSEPEECKFLLVSTGQPLGPLAPCCRYVDTATLYGLVYHLFMVVEDEEEKA